MSEERKSSAGGFSAKQIVIGLLALVVVVLAIVNFESTKVDLVFVTVTMPLFFVIVVAAAVGWLIGHFTGGRRRSDD